MAINAYVNLIVWLKQSTELYNEKHKACLQSIGPNYGLILKVIEKEEDEDKKIADNGFTIATIKLAYVIGITFPGQIKRYIKKLKGYNNKLYTTIFI